MTKRRPSEKVAVRLSPGQVSYLLTMLAKDPTVNARLIADKIKSADLQQDIRQRAWDELERADRLAMKRETIAELEAEGWGSVCPECRMKNGYHSSQCSALNNTDFNQ